MYKIASLAFATTAVVILTGDFVRKSADAHASFATFTTLMLVALLFALFHIISILEKNNPETLNQQTSQKATQM